MSRVREAELTELQINEARDAYRHPPTVAAGLWFVVAELVNLHPMYTVSLVAFVTMFQHCIRASPAAATLEARMAGLVTYMYSHVYRMVSRGLMHSHKLAFGFVMAAAEPRERGEVTQLEWDVFVRSSTLSGTPAAAAARRNSMNGAQSIPAWCTCALWEAILRTEAALPSQLQGLSPAIAAETSAAGGSKQHAGSDNAGRSLPNGTHTGSGSSGATWQQLLLHGSVDDFMAPAVPQHTNRAPDNSRSCLLDQLFLTGGVGQQQQQSTVTTQQLAGCDNDSGSSSSKVEGPSLFVRLVLIKVRCPGFRLGLLWYMPPIFPGSCDMTSQARYYSADQLVTQTPFLFYCIQQQQTTPSPAARYLSPQTTPGSLLCSPPGPAALFLLAGMQGRPAARRYASLCQHHLRALVRRPAHSEAVRRLQRQQPHHTTGVDSGPGG